MNISPTYISAKSLFENSAVVYFDSQFENEPIYKIFGVILQTRDGKENPPRLSTYYAFEGEKYPLCYGFCTTLMNWALLEACNRYMVAHPGKKIVLTVKDLNFDFEEFVPVNELCERYLDIVKAMYKKWLSCSPKLKHFAESDDALFSRILFDEYDHLFDFQCRGIYHDFSDEQIDNFMTWWRCIIDYIVHRYEISMPAYLIPKRVLQDLIEDGLLRLPEGEDFNEFCESATEICIYKTPKKDEQKPQFNMSTYNFYNNAKHIDCSKTININAGSAELSDLVKRFFNDDAHVEKKEKIRGEHLAKTSTPRKGKSSFLPKPYTIKYICQNREMRNKRLQLLLRKWVEWEWIEDVKNFDDFDSFFEGDIRECNLKWIGANVATLYALLQEILNQPFVQKQEKCSARSIGIGQFHIANFRANPLRISDKDKLHITLSLHILNPQKPMPTSNSNHDDESCITDPALAELFADELHITKSI